MPRYRSPANSSLIDRVLLRTVVDESSGCWIWQGAPSGSGGYGYVGWKGKLYRVHRVAYEFFTGPIPAGAVLDHLCHSQNRDCPGGKECVHVRCVNPEHLEVVTQGENASRAHHGKDPMRYGTYERSRTHCPAGHPYEGDNLYVSPSNGKRFCRECNRIRNNAAYQKRKRLR